MLTLRTVNKEIKDRGIDASLIKGDGYFYFVGDDVKCDATGIYVCHLNQLTLADIMEELDEVSIRR